MIQSPRPVLLLAAAFALAPAARAHDPVEIWTEAIVYPDRLELLVTMAQVTALKLADPSARIAALTPDNFPEHRAKLRVEGARLYVVKSDRTPLVARAVAVELTDELDVAFKITLPPPAPGRLRFEATFLTKLGEGYGGILSVGDPAGREIGFEQISWDLPNFEVVLPAAPAPASRKK